MGFLDKFFGPKPPGKDKFARMMMDGIQRAGEKAKIVYDPEQFRLFREGEEGTRLFLGNIYEEYRAAPNDDRATLLQNFTRSWFTADRELPEEFEDVKPDLLPVVRARVYYDNVRLQMQIESRSMQIESRSDADWPQQIIGEHLCVALVYDLPEAMLAINYDDLEGWGLTLYEALEVATENLRQLPHKFIGPAEGKGVYLSNTNDNYDASRLLLLDTIRQFQVKGDHIALVPNRDTLIVTGSEDLQCLRGMIALAKDALPKPRLISGLAFRLDGDAWVPWMPDGENPLYADFRMLQVHSFGQDYSEQKGLLDKLHEKMGEDVFVATYSIVQNEKTGVVSTYALWVADITSWLPRAEMIAFMRKPDDEPRMYNWERVVQVAGHMMEPMDMYPPRFKVSEFPTDEEFAAMGEPFSL